MQKDSSPRREAGVQAVSHYVISTLSYTRVMQAIHSAWSLSIAWNGGGAAALLFACCSLGAHAGQAHVHGVAALEVTVEGDRLTLEFTSPLDNLVGFERAPRTDKEKARVAQALERLRKPEDLFVPSAAARCKAGPVKIDAPVLDTPAKAPKGEHASLAATVEFRCEQPQSLSGVRVMLFDAFPSVKRIDVQVAGVKQQSAARLTSGGRSLSW
jgi:hypothetical protein